MATKKQPTAATGKLKIMVSLGSKELRDWIDDEIHAGIRAGRYPEGYSRSDWINDAIRARRQVAERRNKK